MRGRKWWWVSVFLLLVAGLFLSIPAHAEESQSDSEPLITHFRSIPWGVNEHAVREEMGAPVTTEELLKDHPEGATKVMIYKENILSEKVVIGFGIHAEYGLVKGLFQIFPSSEDDCKSVYEKFHDAIQSQYQEIQPRDIEFNKSAWVEKGYIDFCDAIGMGEAHRMTFWNDPVNGATIRMKIDDEGHTEIHYETKTFLTIQETAKEKEKQKAF